MSEVQLVTKHGRVGIYLGEVWLANVATYALADVLVRILRGLSPETLEKLATRPKKGSAE